MSLVSCTKNILGTTGRPQYWPRQTTAYAAFIPGYMLSRYKLYPLSSSVSCISDKIIVGARFPLPEFTARVHGPSTRVHFLTPVNSARELGQWKPGFTATCIHLCPDTSCTSGILIVSGYMYPGVTAALDQDTLDQDHEILNPPQLRLTSRKPLWLSLIHI